MAEHINAIQDLQKYSDNVHIFCPRGTDEDTDDQNANSSPHEEAQRRTDKFFAALPLLAYDGEECKQFHRWIYETLDHQLKRCDRCIQSYYIGKIAFKTHLLQEYEEEEVRSFMGIIDRRDVARIRAGLDSAAKKLEAVPVEDRGMKAISEEELYAFFETLHCHTFLNDEQLLRQHFDVPFKLIQTKKELKITEILPATTKFLFSTDPFRLNWAFSAWQRFKRSPTDKEWSWAMKDILSHELNTIKNEAGLIRFWSALRIIIDKLSREQISLRLFDMGFNFTRLTLDHLAKPTMAVSHIIHSLSIIWEKNPEAFWQPLPSVSAATVAEQVFASPQFDKCLDQQSGGQNRDGPYDVLFWVEPFLNGLQAPSRPPAMRTIVNELLKRAKLSTMSEDTRQLCFYWAVRCLAVTVSVFSDNDAVRKTTARPILSDLLITIGSVMSTILSYKVEGPPAQRTNTNDEVLFVVRNSLHLEGQLLRADFDALRNNQPRVSNSSFTPYLWRGVQDFLTENRVDLSTNFLRGIMPFVGLEVFPVRNDTKFTAEKGSFNTVFTKIEAAMIDCVERLKEFPSSHLDSLFSSQETSMSLMGLLFSGNDELYQSTVQLFKNISEQPGRIEALTHVFISFLDTSIYSVSWVFRRIANTECFAPIPRLLKTGRDIMDILCDSTGLLRNPKPERRQREAVQAYWQYSWLIMATIFRKMEKWSIAIHDKPLMTEVCRNTMQYAQQLFQHYYLFVQVLEYGQSRQVQADIPINLLNMDATSTSGSPPKALDWMVRWLRLRDPYLAETLVDLIVDMLRRLKEYGSLIPDDTYSLTFVQEVVTGAREKGKVTKTVLNENQKAALIRALESYTGKQIAKPVPKVKKQQRIDLTSWTETGSRRSASTTPKPEVITLDDESGNEIKDDDLLQGEKVELRAAELDRRRALLAEKKEKLALERKQARAATAVRSQQDIKAKQAAVSRAFIEQRKAEVAARKARDAEIAAKVRGQASGHTANAGSGLAGLGVEAKDHNVVRSDLMVSSGSEAESSDDDDDDDELFGSVKGPAVQSSGPQFVKGVPMPTRVKKQARSVKDMRARLSPDLTGLHKTILGWDFFDETDTPPNSTREDYTLVTSTFKTVEDYQKTFEPLLVLEGWQGFRSEREDANFKPFELKVANSLIVDNFFEINTQVSMKEGKELGLGPSDVVLLSRGSRPHAEPTEPHCLARIKEITRKKGEMQIVYRVNSANNPLRPYLNDKATIWAVRVLSLTPLEREYGALMALRYYDLAEEIIKAKPSPLLDYTDAEVRHIEKVYNVNTAQAKAVKSAIDNDAFTLVQGPPGSGKTKTICAILGAILGPTTTNRSDLSKLSGRSTAVPVTKKVLVAAPSNAAVDELVMRFKDGIRRLDGSSEKINVVRMGRSDVINTAVKDVTLEELVNARLNAASNLNGSAGKEDIQAIMMQHQKVSREVVELRDKLSDIRIKGEQVAPKDDQLLDSLRREKGSLSSKIDDLRETQNSATRDADINRRKLQQEILDSAHVLCATLSGSGHDLFQSVNVEFETVIIDEAAQSIELSALIPLKYGCSKCILVGDPKQLPPTVLSRQAAKYQYEQSLFARMEGNHNKDVHLLDVQYRMHPEISAFPSKTFYDSRLRDGGDMARLRARPWHRSAVLSPYRFFDVQGMSESAPKGRSLVNKAEIEVALQMYDRLITDVTQYNFRGKLGIITPYKGQLKALKQRFSSRYGENILDMIDFNTTDAFQGRESEIIIFSCVRASTQGIGFLNDVRRMNVGLTRAKCSLWVLGNSQALVQGEFWRALVTDSKARNLYTDGNILQLFKRPLLTADMMKDDVVMGGVDDHLNSTSSYAEETVSATSNGKARDTSMERSSTANDDGRTNRASAQSSGRSTPQSRPELPSRQSSSCSVPKSGNGIISATSASKPSKRQESIVGAAKGPDGPAGGRFGLNSKVNCAICGSDNHFSHNCTNAQAREAQLGTCKRCGIVGHTQGDCQAERCVACGEIGHLEESCRKTSEERLTERERLRVVDDEQKFQQFQKTGKIKRAEKQLGEHGASIPKIKDGVESRSYVAGNDAKRKRDGAEEETVSKNAKLRGEAANPSALKSAPSATPAAAAVPSVVRPAGAVVRANVQVLVRKKKVDENAMFAKRR